MDDWDAFEACAEEFDRAARGVAEYVDFDAGACGVAHLGAEGVAEDAAEGSSGLLIGVEGDIVRGSEGEGAEVIHSEDVVGVRVGVENGVDAGDALADGLCVEVGAGIDEDGAEGVLWFAGRHAWKLEAQRGPGAAVARVSFGGAGSSCARAADGTGAAKGGYAHGGATAEEGEGRLHG